MKQRKLLISFVAMTLGRVILVVAACAEGTEPELMRLGMANRTVPLPEIALVIRSGETGKLDFNLAG